MDQSWFRPSGSRSTGSLNRSDINLEMEVLATMHRHRHDTFPARKKSKRFRSFFTTDQISYLEMEFKKNPYIDTAHRKEVANLLNITEKAVKVWFQNRRMKEKKDFKEQESEDQVGRNYIRPRLTMSSSMTVPVTMPLVKDSSYSLTQLNLTGPAQNINSSTDTEKEMVIADVTYEKKLLQRPNCDSDTPIVKAEAKVASLYFSHPGTSRDFQSQYKSSAEFSIDLCKKYKTSAPPPAVNDTDKSIGQTLSACSTKIETKLPPPCNALPSMEYQSSPEDLSCKSRKKELEFDPPKTVTYNSAGSFPVYVNYSPMYSVAESTMWKPVNVVPIVPTGVSAVNISSNLSSSSGLVPQEASPPKRKCSNCNCHQELPTVMPNALPTDPQNQLYVITAFQPHPKP